MSWNVNGVTKYLMMSVTLHVSVWVEISLFAFYFFLLSVTLHVSVWVEIDHWLVSSCHSQSRSTWACELKCIKLHFRSKQSCHAPRERVSWNLGNSYQLQNRCTSRSTWACELKFVKNFTKISNTPSRSTWACELKLTAYTARALKKLSRSTWACELKYHWNITR